MRTLELTGQRFGRLAAMERAGSNKFGQALWLCRCDCGAEATVPATALRRNVRSCGCLASAVLLSPATSDAARLWSRVDVRGPDDCWNWVGRVHRTGYGTLRVGPHTAMAHRLSWVLARGNPDPRLKVCHRCDNPRCVNPAHLFLGTNAENMRDASAKGRTASPDRVGVRNQNARLTPEKVREIRALHACGAAVGALAVRFGTGRSNISEIVHGRLWKSVDGKAA